MRPFNDRLSDLAARPASPPANCNFNPGSIAYLRHGGNPRTLVRVLERRRDGHLLVASDGIRHLVWPTDLIAVIDGVPA